MGNVCNNMAGSSNGRAVSTRTAGHIYPNKNAAIVDLNSKLDKYPATKDTTFNPLTNYTSDFNSWILSTYYTKATEQKVHATTDEGITYYWITRRTLEWAYSGGTLKVHSMASSSILKDTNNRTCWMIFVKVRSLMPKSQGDDGESVSQESIQGRPDQTSDKQASTIITADTTVEESHQIANKNTEQFASSEPLTTYDYLTTRWMPYDKFTFDTSQNTGYEIMTIWLPEMFYKKANCAPNNIPFETFVYGKMDVEVKIVVNGNKFQTGKLVASVKFDTYQADSCSDGYQGALTRNHVILDVPARNEGVLHIPFVYHRALLRLVKTGVTSKGVRSAKYATVSIKVLSPMVVGTDNYNSCVGQVFYRFCNAQFTGLSYRVTLQGDNVTDDLIRSVVPVKALKALTVGAEAALEQYGKSSNQDKPTGLNAMIVIPQPRRFFCTTGGIADCVPLRANPTALTTFKHTPKPKGEPKTTLDIARIWGLWKDFKWNQSSDTGSVLVDLTVDPTIRSADKDYIGAPTPIEYICGMYQFWNGTIELRFDFVSTSFHTGAVLISVEFNRPLSTDTLCAAASTYTTTFHLGEQKSVRCVVPYIYDTVFRRNNGTLINDNYDETTSTNLRSRAYSIAALSNTRVRVVVLNALKPPTTVTPEIAVLVFMRAGPDFSVMSLKTTQYFDYMADKEMNSFPRDYAGSIYMDSVMAQMDSGKDNKDETHTFNRGTNAQLCQTIDVNIDIVSILRRPICIVDKVKVTQRSNDVVGFFIPVQPPSRSFMARSNVKTVFSGSIPYTAHAALVNCFRHWRGSTRYTFVIHGKSYVNAITYLPHSGVRLVGNQEMGAAGGIMSPYKLGFATELQLATINTSTHVEVPYETENDWTLTFEEDANRNYTWRDKGDTNAGHIVYQALDADAEISVWWAAGDDFELSNWYGIPWCKSNDVQYRLDDNVEQVEKFNDTDITTGKIETQEVKDRARKSRNLEQLKDNKISTTPPVEQPVTQMESQYVVLPQEQQPEVVMTRKKGKKKGKRPVRYVSPDTESVSSQGLFSDLVSYIYNPGEERDPHTGWTLAQREEYLEALTPELRAHFFELEERQSWSELKTWVVANLYDVPLDRIINVGTRLEEQPGPSTQPQDFRPVNTLTSVKSVMTNKIVQNMMLGSVPLVGTGLVAGRVAGEITEHAESLVGMASQVVDNTTTLTNSANTTLLSVKDDVHTMALNTTAGVNVVEQLQDPIKNLALSMSTLANKLNTKVDLVSSIMEQTLGKLSNLFSVGAGVTTAVTNFLLDLVIAWFDKSWTAVGVGLVRILISTMPGTLYTTVSSYAVELGRVLSGYFNSMRQTMAQADTDSVATTIITILAGMLGTVLGVIVRPTTNSFLKDLLIRMTHTSGISYFVQIMNFVKSTFKTIKAMVLDALGIVSPEAQALSALSGQSEALKLFIQNAQTITSEANSPMLHVPSYRIKVWQTVLQAQRYQQMMTEVPNSCVSPVLSRLCTDVIKYGNERFLDLAACPVRYEPYIVCITGPPGVGKSHMTNRLITSMLAHIGYSAPASGVAYYRTPLSQYWSGYRDQPVVVFDEWMHLNDSNACALQLAELYQLKSTTPFIPSMAHLEEKKIHGNPLIVVLLCNNAFPPLDKVHHKTSVLRRREEVISVVCKEEFEGINPRDLTPEQQENYEHLAFERYERVDDPGSNTSELIDFPEFVTYMCESFERYHAQELRNVSRQMEQLNTLNRVVPVDAHIIRDPFAVFYNNVTPVIVPDSDEWVPTERLRTDVRSLVEALEAQQIPPQELHNTHVPPRPVWGTGEQRVMIDDRDDGEPQAQIGPIAALAVETVLSNVTHLAGYAWHGMRYLSENLADMIRSMVPRSAIRGSCSVCYAEDAEITSLCEGVLPHYQQTLEIQHAVCVACVAHIRRTGHNRCAVCRQNMVAITTQAELNWFVKVLKILSNVLDHAGTFCDFMAQMTFLMGDWTRWTFMYSALYFLFETGMDLATGGTFHLGHKVVLLVIGTITAIHVVDTAYRDVPLWPSFAYQVSAFEAMVRNDMDIYGRPTTETGPLNILRSIDVSELVVGAPVVQMEPQPSTSRDTGMSRAAHSARDLRRYNLSSESIFAPPVSQTITYELIERRARVEAPEPGVCLHRILENHIDSAQYTEGWWHITYMGARVKVWDGPCQEAYCAWKPLPLVGCHRVGIGLQREFYRKYLEARRDQLVNHFVAYHNATGLQKDFIKNKIPKVYQPEWLFGPIELDQQMINMVSPSWWQWLHSAFENYRHIFEVAAIVAGVAALLYGCWVAGSAVFGSAGPVAQSPPHQNAAHVTPRRGAARVSRGSYFAESQSEPTIEDVVGAYIHQNTVVVRLLDEYGNCARLLSAIGLYQHVALVPGHYVGTIENWKHQIVLENMQRPYLNQRYTYSSQDFKRSTLNDIALWTLPNSWNSFKDIRKFLVKDEDLNKVMPSEAVLFVVPTRHNPHMTQVEVDILGIVNSMTVGNPDGGTIDLIDVVEYNFSKSGACGSLLVLPRTQRPILSMHVAGVGSGMHGKGYGLILSQEALGELKGPDTSVPDTVVTQGEELMEIVWPPEVQVDYHGSVEADKKPWVPIKSKLKKSSIHGADGLVVDIEPAILNRNDPRYVHDVSPLIAGCEAHGKLTKNFPRHWLEGPRVFLQQKLKAMKPMVVKPKVLTESEAICGLDMPYYDPIDVNTSAGYPLTLTGKSAKKQWMTLQRNDQEQLIHGELIGEAKKFFDEASETRKRGVRYPTIFTDTLKDEKRPKAKLMKRGGTRIFCNGPLEHMLHMRRNFLHFSAAFMHRRNDLMHAVGINPCGPEWDGLARTLLAKGKKICTLDYTNFGPGFNACVARVALDLILEWTLREVEGVDENEARLLLEECANSVHIAGNTVYSQLCGSPSGAVLTTVINSLVNMLYILVAFEQLVTPVLRREHGKMTPIFEEFNNNVALCVYGDDLVMSVSDKHIETFNAQTISKFFGEFDIVATDASKTEVVVPYTDLLRAEFLKRKWVRHPSRRVWMSQLRYETIKSTTQWVWESPNLKESTRTNCEVAMMLAHGLGPVQFQATLELVNNALIKAGIDPVTLTWKEVDDCIYEYGCVQAFW